MEGGAAGSQKGLGGQEPRPPGEAKGAREEGERGWVEKERGSRKYAERGRAREKIRNRGVREKQKRPRM